MLDFAYEINPFKELNSLRCSGTRPRSHDSIEASEEYSQPMVDLVSAIQSRLEASRLQFLQMNRASMPDF